MHIRRHLLLDQLSASQKQILAPHGGEVPWGPGGNGRLRVRKSYHQDAWMLLGGGAQQACWGLPLNHESAFALDLKLPMHPIPNIKLINNCHWILVTTDAIQHTRYFWLVEVWNLFSAWCSHHCIGKQVTCYSLKGCSFICIHHKLIHLYFSSINSSTEQCMHDTHTFFGQWEQVTCICTSILDTIF